MRVVNLASDMSSTKSSRGFVPTMGALHAGHISLVDQAKRECEEVVLSIYVNPTQFGEEEDYSRYPRTFDRDKELAEAAGVDWLYVPTTEEIYPAGTGEVVISVPRVGAQFEGAFRPHHFDGVSTVVWRLLTLVAPNRAYFGNKDLQQLRVVQTMVRGLGMPVEIIGCPIVREPSGLALSSRNSYLSDEEKLIASSIHANLVTIKSAYEKEEFNQVIYEINKAKSSLSKTFRVEYLELINSESFEVAKKIEPRQAIVFAGWLGNTRLIDNVLLEDIPSGQ